MEQLSQTPIQWNRISIPELKGRIKHEKTKTLTGQDTMSHLICPSLRISYQPTMNYSKFTISSERQAPPCRKAIDELTSMKVTQLRQSPTRYNSSQVKKEKEDFLSSNYRLKKAKSQRWFSQDNSFSEQPQPATRFSSRPHRLLKSADKLTPARCWSVPKVLKTSALRFEEVKLKEERDLGNYLVRSDNIFRTEYLKNSSLKDRKLNPLNHPEFDPTNIEFHRKRDQEIKYREAFLRAKNMIKPDHK
jgi:hypothetical protein